MNSAMKLYDFFHNPLSVTILVFLSDVVAYGSLFVRLFRVLCLFDLTLSQMPLLNPYEWPFNISRILTEGYFKYWRFLLPTIKIGKHGYDISVIMSLEFLVTLITLCVNIRGILLLQACYILEKYNEMN